MQPHDHEMVHAAVHSPGRTVRHCSQVRTDNNYVMNNGVVIYSYSDMGCTDYSEAPSLKFIVP